MRRSSARAVISAKPTLATAASPSARTVPSPQVMANVTPKTERASARIRIDDLAARDRLRGGDGLAAARPLRIAPADEKRACERRERHDARRARMPEEPVVGAAEVRVEGVGVEHAREDGDGDDERDGVEHEEVAPAKD